MPKSSTTKSLIKEITKGSHIFFDSETCGLHGMMVLAQWAVDEGPIHLWDVWLKPIGDTLDLIEAMIPRTMVFFNASFDWFHVIKLYNVFRLCPREWIPIQHVNEIADKEDEAKLGPCLKPAHTLDLMLHARKGPYQSLMARSDIRVRRVPTTLADALAQELESRIEIDSIYFARTADKDAPRWGVFDILNKQTGEIDQNFKDVVLRFNPAGGLKFLAEHALGLKPKFHFKDVEPPTHLRPKELGYAPTASAVSKASRNWEVYKTKDGKRQMVGYAWPGVIAEHVKHWKEKANAREYAEDDIVYTRGVYHHFGKPEADDDDSILACMVSSVRWHGYSINLRGIRRMMKLAKAKVAASPVNINKPSEVKRYILACCDENEGLLLHQSTKKKNIEKIKDWVVEEDEPCMKCESPGQPCLRCGGAGVLHTGKHPAAVRAAEILAIKLAGKEVELYVKLLRAKRLHASFNVIGTLSSRMSGADGLNPQGIKKTKDVRKLFTLTWKGMKLCGGDFDSFEVVLADAVWGDKNLRSDLMNGKKIHALFAMSLFPGKTYAEIIASEGSDNDMYSAGKSGVFGTFYGGDHNTLVNNLNIPEAVAKKAFDDLSRRYPEMAKSRQKTFDAFCSMKQPQAGGAVYWANPADYIESFLGFRRYFTLENKVCQALFHLAQKPPKPWRDYKVKVKRRDREQFAVGAVSSALYGAAFQIQAGNMRAAANHEIQSPGAEITKRVQRLVWDLQPAGVHEFVVVPMNIHDELLSVTDPEVIPAVTEKVREGVEHYRPKVPLIGMTWNEIMSSWAEKKGGSRTVSISWKKPS